MTNFKLVDHSLAMGSCFECYIRATQERPSILWSARVVSALALCETGIFSSHPFVQTGTDQF